MDSFLLKDQEYFIIDSWIKRFPNLVVGFTTKNGGVSNGHYLSLNVGFHVNDSYQSVISNRERIGELLNFPICNWVGAEQTHEIAIKEIKYTDRGKGASQYSDSFLKTDGFFTFEKDVLLTLCFADCVPLYFLHPNTQAIGIAHAGWKGTVNGIAGEMIEVFQKHNIDKKEIMVVIGPSICKNCYIVDEHVISMVKNRLDNVDKKPYNLIKHNQYQLDLKELNKQILLKAGLLEDNIVLTSLCTSCDHEFFYSHRRDKGHTGRMMSFIGWKEGAHK